MCSLNERVDLNDENLKWKVRQQVLLKFEWQCNEMIDWLKFWLYQLKTFEVYLCQLLFVSKHLNLNTANKLSQNINKECQLIAHSKGKRDNIHKLNSIQWIYEKE